MLIYKSSRKKSPSDFAIMVSTVVNSFLYCRTSQSHKCTTCIMDSLERIICSILVYFVKQKRILIAVVVRKVLLKTFVMGTL